MRSDVTCYPLTSPSQLLWSFAVQAVAAAIPGQRAVPHSAAAVAAAGAGCRRRLGRRPAGGAAGAVCRAAGAVPAQHGSLQDTAGLPGARIALPRWYGMFKPGSTVLLTVVWRTGLFPPGRYKITMDHVTPAPVSRMLAHELAPAGSPVGHAVNTLRKLLWTDRRATTSWQQRPRTCGVRCGAASRPCSQT